MTTPENFPFELEPGERLLWSGAPRKGLAFRPADFLQVPISLIILYVLAKQFRYMSFAGPVDVAIATVLTLAVFYVVVGRFFFDAYRRGKTAYALTSERMLIRESVFSNFVKSFPLNTITDTFLFDLPRGFGNIRIGRRYLPVGWQDSRLSATRGHPNGFAMIPDASHVYDLLEAARLTRPAPTLQSLFEKRGA
ncbi:MAG TPA: hypothetical protein VLI43_04580 [Gemmatimonadaceae bacterium]|nr:hypothetical protein [Gemmatimonadaceae bacterium]